MVLTLWELTFGVIVYINSLLTTGIKGTTIIFADDTAFVILFHSSKFVSKLRILPSSPKKKKISEAL